MHVNAKIIPAETVTRIGGKGIKRAVEEVNSSMIHLIHYKNFSKCYNVFPPSTIIIIIINK
jgi:hypothetical protein